MSSVRGSARHGKDQTLEKPETPPVEPLGPYTPEAANAISSALESRDKSAQLRHSLARAIAEIDQLQRSMHSSVNHGITQKVAETVNIKVFFENSKLFSTSQF